MVVEKYLLNGWNGTTDIWREVVLFTDYQALEREIERLKHPILREDVTLKGKTGEKGGIGDEKL